MSIFIRYRRRKFFLKIFFLCAIIVVIFIMYRSLKIESARKTIELRNLTTNIIEMKPDLNNDYQMLVHGSTFTGVSKDLKPYSIKSAKANKISEGIFDLQHIDLNYNIGNDQLSIIAKNGSIDNTKNSIILKDNVAIYFSDLILNTKEININLLTKDLYSNSHVEMLFRNTKIDADSLATDNNNDILILRGNVHTKIDSSDFKQ